MAAQVGGVVWLPFLVAFLVALVTAFSYLELVTKYPQGAGAALCTHKAFGIHFLTFLVAFAVMNSGITSASTAAFTGRPAEQYRIAGILLAIGVVLWGITVAANRRTGARTPAFDPGHLTGEGPTGPRN